MKANYDSLYECESFPDTSGVEDEDTKSKRLNNSKSENSAGEIKDAFKNNATILKGYVLITPNENRYVFEIHE